MLTPLTPSHPSPLIPSPLTDEVLRMRDVVMEEYLDDMDKDKDGLVTLEEYVSE